MGLFKSGPLFTQNYIRTFLSIEEKHLSSSYRDISRVRNSVFFISTFLQLISLQEITDESRYVLSQL